MTAYDDIPDGGSDHTAVHRAIATALDATVLPDPGPFVVGYVLGVVDGTPTWQQIDTPLGDSDLFLKVGTGMSLASEATDGYVLTADGLGGSAWEAATGGGGGAPSGPAGGVLSGTYPDPGFAVDMATQAELDAHASDTTSVHGIADTSALATTSAIAAGYQPLDSDLTAIAALTTTTYGRALLALADAAALRTAGGVVNYPWTEIVKASDQTVTNSSTLVDDSELQFSCVSGGVYHVELMLLWSANDVTGDFKFEVAVPTATGFRRNVAGFGGGTDVIQASTGVQFSAATALLGGGVQLGGDAGDTIKVQQLEAWFRAGAAASFKVQFANFAASSGRTSTSRAGSVLRYRRLA